MTDTTLPEPVAMIDEVVAFFVKHGMLDKRDEYSLDDVIGALRDNYEPSETTALQEALDRLAECEAALLRVGESLGLDHVTAFNIIDAIQSRATAAEAAIESAWKVIEGLEGACNQLAATRTHAIYLAMIDDGQSDELLSLDERRRTARQWLTANQKEVKG